MTPCRRSRRHQRFYECDAPFTGLGYARAVDRLAIERALSEHLAEHEPSVYAAYLFGSVARGTDTTNSDVDVAVLLDVGAPRTLAEVPTRLAEDLGALLGRRVDLITLDSAPPDLIHRVLRDGRLLLDRNKSRRIAFEVKARNEYFDIKPYLDRYRAARPSA